MAQIWESANLRNGAKTPEDSYGKKSVWWKTLSLGPKHTRETGLSFMELVWQDTGEKAAALPVPSI